MVVRIKPPLSTSSLLHTLFPNKVDDVMKIIEIVPGSSRMECVSARSSDIVAGRRAGTLFGADEETEKYDSMVCYAKLYLT